jgi:hypothetical protein
LYTDADRARATAIETEATTMQAEVDRVQEKHIRAAFDKVLATFPTEQRDALRTAFQTAPGQRTAEQKQLVATNPKLNITPGVLYQYNAAAAEELKKLRANIAAKRAEKPIEDFVAIFDEVPGVVPTTKVFYRGDHRQPTTVVMPGDLTIAAPEGQRVEIAAKDASLPSTGRRLAYARHLTNGQHPLLGRVLANRLWLHHFGRGLVDTPGDFGILGQRPTHPELLDWLATEMVREEWSLKRMHRLIVMSMVYRQSSQRDKAKDAVDPSGSLYSRYPLRRLDAETLRDRVLATTGRLDRTMFGPAVAVSEDIVGQVIAPEDRPRRSLYLQVRRSKPLALLSTFDAPTGELNCEKRTVSTAAPQSLMLMNGEFILHQAGHFASRLLAESHPSLRSRLARAWQLAYQRSASVEEVDLACGFVERQTSQLRGAVGDKAERAALTNLCQQLLASNEILYVP